MLDAADVSAPSNQLFVNHQQVKYIEQIVLQVLYFDVMSHNEVKQALRNSREEGLFRHVSILFLGEVGIWLGPLHL